MQNKRCVLSDQLKRQEMMKDFRWSFRCLFQFPVPRGRPSDRKSCFQARSRTSCTSRIHPVFLLSNTYYSLCMSKQRFPLLRTSIPGGHHPGRPLSWRHSLSSGVHSDSPVNQAGYKSDLACSFPLSLLPVPEQDAYGCPRQEAGKIRPYSGEPDNSMNYTIT